MNAFNKPYSFLSHTIGSARPNTDCLASSNGVCTKRNIVQANYFWDHFKLKLKLKKVEKSDFKNWTFFEGILNPHTHTKPLILTTEVAATRTNPLTYT